MRWMMLCATVVSIVALSCAGKASRAERTSSSGAKTRATSPPASRSSSTAPTSRRSDAEAAARAAMDPLVPPPHPVPLLSPEEEIKTFNLPAGFHAEVVACEPMVQHPIFITFDPDGRMWVLEMRGYMPNIEGKGENEPIGRVSVCEDTDGDGRMDKSTVFLDHLVLPRALALAKDGVLVGEPPKLWFCRDTNGDGVADDRTLIASDYGDGVNPEHQANGLLYNLDNWYCNADYEKRFRNDGGKWLTDVVLDRGQWGISQDDVGRLYHDNNSDYLRGNLIAPMYAARNPNFSAAGVNVQIDHDQEVFPAHDTAENRGYRPGFLRPDGTLHKVTAACSPWIYRAQLFPKDFYGNAFVAEASCNVVRRSILSEEDAIVTGKNAYDQKEFIASTYERFRPVSFATGPEGALYIVDMHHGLIQHHGYETPYVKAQYKARELDQHLMTGRIFRIVPDGAKPQPAAKMSKMLSPQLVECLSNPNAWVRETAQRLLVERNVSAASGPLKKLATSGANSLGRIHALWTLDGMHRLDAPTVRAGLNDADPRVRAQAIRLAEPILGTRQRDELLGDVLKLEADAQPNVRLQFVLTVSAVGIPKTDEVIARVLTSDSHNLYVRDGALSGMRARELEFLERLANDPAWSKEATGRAALLKSLAVCVMNEGRGPRVGKLLDIAATQQLRWRQDALLAGIDEIGKSKYVRRPVMLPSAPTALIAMKSDVAASALSHIVWPGKPGYVPPPPPKPLTPAEQQRYALGQQVYAKTCIQCHKIDGLGQEGLAPPLVNSEWVLGSEQRIGRIVLNGLRGPITVGAKTYNLDMPSWGILNDDQLAAVLTYVRRSWDHDASPVDPSLMAQLRKETAGRMEAWSERELLHVR